jgi:hypothetical protein
MKKEKFKKGLELLEETLDPLSDRYRICPNPPCGRPHMVKNKSRDYCSDKCADDHYNFIRKYRQQHEAEKGKKVELEKSTIEAEKQKEIDWKLDPEWLKIHNNNIDILSSLAIDSANGTQFPLDYLINLGANLTAYTAIGTYYTIDETYNSRSLVIGDYKLYLIDYNVILVYYNDPQNVKS